ncbi:MAG: TlpA disulfide reductase family protein [Dehalococcoidia bacterium]|nr:TlpA disulfide reductase family protein [Dehalococcoidia bacterium]
MDFSKTNRLLWIVLAAIIVLIAAVAVADRVIHANASIPVPSSASEPAGQTDVKTGTSIGFAAPDFTLPTTDAKEFKLSDYRGKNVILNFWATWCGPCRLEIPAFKEIHNKYNDGSIVVVAISCLDNADSTAYFASANGMDFVIPLDPRGVVSDLYNIRGMPTTYFINDKGVITSIKIGPFINIEEIEERLDSFR